MYEIAIGLVSELCDKTEFCEKNVARYILGNEIHVNERNCIPIASSWLKLFERALCCTLILHRSERSLTDLGSWRLLNCTIGCH